MYLSSIALDSHIKPNSEVIRFFTQQLITQRYKNQHVSLRNDMYVNEHKTIQL
jgi:hypothetical protein